MESRRKLLEEWILVSTPNAKESIVASIQTNVLIPLDSAAVAGVKRQRGLRRKGATQSFSSLTLRRVIRVLVVDSDPEVADELAWWLHCCGHTPRIAYDAHSALRMAAAQHPQLVLLNLEMPYFDGCQVARQLRFDFPRNDCFIIGITWRTDEERRRQSIEAGIDLLLIKPVERLIVETLLMLESVRAHKLITSNTARLTDGDRLACKQRLNFLPWRQEHVAPANHGTGQ